MFQDLVSVCIDPFQFHPITSNIHHNLYHEAIVGVDFHLIVSYGFYVAVRSILFLIYVAKKLGIEHEYVRFPLDLHLFHRVEKKHSGIQQVQDLLQKIHEELFEISSFDPDRLLDLSPDLLPVPHERNRGIDRIDKNLFQAMSECLKLRIRGVLQKLIFFFLIL